MAQVADRCRVAGLVLTMLATAAPASAQRYRAVQQDDVVTLTDTQAETVVVVVPSVGNIATEMRVKGHNVLRYPHASLADFTARPAPPAFPSWRRGSTASRSRPSTPTGGVTPST